MPIRLARHSELATVSAIFAAGFHDEEVVGTILHPRRLQYPADYLGYWQRRCRERWWQYSRVFLVSFEPEDDGGEGGMGKGGREILTGAAEWMKMGSGWERVWGIWGRWDPRRLMAPILAFINKLASIVRPNRAASQPPEITPDSLEPILFPFISHRYLSPPHRQNQWNLECIAVLPQHQNRGYGREMVAWGVDRAREEGVTTGVMAAKGKEMFYRRCGFTILAGWATEGKGNPLYGRVSGGAIMYSPVKEDKNVDDGESEIIEISAPLITEDISPAS